MCECVHMCVLVYTHVVVCACMCLVNVHMHMCVCMSTHASSVALCFCIVRGCSYMLWERQFSMKQMRMIFSSRWLGVSLGPPGPRLEPC